MGEIGKPVRIVEIPRPTTPDAPPKDAPAPVREPEQVPVPA